ncbi:CHAP domain-containing protein [Leifsonia sp. McL0607]|uniref:CHAP domain-containing protein n=1 Tax=Leifsonia sp. McL0607 TaxID=3415672 RepID=UPI003CF6636C
MPSRRAVLAGAAAVIAFGGAFLSSPAFASGMPSLGQVISAAQSTKGCTLAQCKQILGVDGIWAEYANEWCAWFVTWLLRDNGIAFSPADFTVSTLRSRFPADRLGSTPLPGALIFYPGHVGLVTDVVGGYPKTIEGNTGYYRGATDWANSTVNTFTGGSAQILGYAYPEYDGYDSLTGAGTIGASIEGNTFMALTDAEQAELLAGVRALIGFVYAGGPAVSGTPGRDFAPDSLMGRVNSLEESVFSGGPSMPDNQKSIGTSLAEIQAAVNRKH